MRNADYVDEITVVDIKDDVASHRETAVSRVNIGSFATQRRILGKALKALRQGAHVALQSTDIPFLKGVVGYSIKIFERSRRQFPSMPHTRALARAITSSTSKSLTKSCLAACPAPSARCARSASSRLPRSSNSRKAARTTSLADEYRPLFISPLMNSSQCPPRLSDVVAILLSPPPRKYS